MKAKSILKVKKRKGYWIQTFTGKRIYPFDPDPDLICIEDIAHALSNICRFTGHVKHFYSVAQHSVIVANAIPDSLGVPHTNELYLQALLHDAQEYLFSDLSRPLKRSLSKNNPILTGEERAQKIIFEKFGLSYSDIRKNSKYVKRMDEIVLMIEGRELMGNTIGWHDTTEILIPSWGIEPFQPEQAEQLFLDSLHRIINIRNNANK